MYIAVAVALAITGLAFLAWINPLTIGPIGPIGTVDLRITDVHFHNDYLNVTVKNVGCSGTVISGVTVNQTSTPHTIPLHEQIWAGEEISVRIDFKWTSGYAYQIKLETEDKENWDHIDTTVAVAP